MQRIDESQNGQELNLKVGDEIELELAENPTTGYRWYLQSPDEAGSVAVQDDEQVGGEAPGAGGRRTWRLRATAAGVTHIRFDHRRGWEGAPTRSFGLTIRAENR